MITLREKNLLENERHERSAAARTLRSQDFQDEQDFYSRESGTSLLSIPLHRSKTSVSQPWLRKCPMRHKSLFRNIQNLCRVHRYRHFTKEYRRFTFRYRRFTEQNRSFTEQNRRSDEISRRFGK